MKEKKSMPNYIVPIIAGAILLIAGAILYFFMSERIKNSSFFLIFFCAGCATIIPGILSVIRQKMQSPEQKKREENEANDERNKMIGGQVSAAAYVSMLFVSTVQVFTGIALENNLLIWFAFAGEILSFIVGLIVQAVLNKKM